MHETIAGDLAARLGHAAAAQLWQERANLRQQRMQALMWDAKRGAFFDYDYTRQELSPVFSCASFLPLWAGVASPEQAAKTVALLPRLEQAHGVSTCEPGTARAELYQWDHPNAWAPTTWQMVQGLKRYGYNTEAKRIAQKYVSAATAIFAKTGTLWEKYNAVTGDIDVVDEYAMPEMLGWSAGVYIALSEEI